MRLDEYVHHNGYTESRSKAQDIILAGCVFVNGVKVTSKAQKIKDTDKIEIIQNRKYVSRAGEKLEKALLEFNLSVENKICLDIGASTGGFTDCLLCYGAKKVYALDVGHNQLVYKLKNDNRVISIEDFNAKDIKREMFEGETPYDLEYWVSLIKPQFEAEKGEVSKGGVIKDDILREKIVNNAINRITEIGFKEINRTISPIKGSKGNIEYLSYFII